MCYNKGYCFENQPLNHTASLTSSTPPPAQNTRLIPELKKSLSVQILQNLKKT